LKKLFNKAKTAHLNVTTQTDCFINSIDMKF